LNSGATTPKTNESKAQINKYKTTCLENAQYTKPERIGTYVLHAVVELRKTRQRLHAMVCARDGTTLFARSYN